MIQYEYHEACAFHDWLELAHIKHFHVPNETGGNHRRGVYNLKMGVSSGVPDFFVFLPNGVNIAIELKRADHKNKATKNQVAWLDILAQHGFKTCVAYGAIEAIEFVKQYALKRSACDII